MSPHSWAAGGENDAGRMPDTAAHPSPPRAPLVAALLSFYLCSVAFLRVHELPCWVDYIMKQMQNFWLSHMRSERVAGGGCQPEPRGACDNQRPEAMKASAKYMWVQSASLPVTGRSMTLVSKVERRTA